MEQFEISGITKKWFFRAAKEYTQQIKVDKNGKETFVTKLKIEQP